MKRCPNCRCEYENYEYDKKGFVRCPVCQDSVIGFELYKELQKKELKK